MNFGFSKIPLRLTACLLFFSILNIFAQEAPYGSLGLRRIYQSTLINPTLVPDATSIENSLSFVPFLPVSVFDMGVKADMGAFSLGTLTSSIQAGNLNLNTLVNNMNDSKNANTFVGLNASLIHVYLKVGKKGAKFEFSQRLKVSASTNMLNKNTFNVLINDNDNENINRYVDLTDSRMRSMAWNEISMGYTRPIDDKLVVGGRIKYLTGIVYADFNSTNFTGTIGPDGNSFNIDSRVRTSSLNPISDEAYNQDLTKYKSNDMSQMILSGLGKNIGFGLDAGISYKIKEDLKLFAGFNDLGYISWNSNPLVYNNKAIINDFYPVKQNPETETYEVNFEEFTKSGSVTASSFKTMLNTHFNSGVTWKKLKYFHATALVDGYLINGALSYPGATVAGTLNGGNFSEFTLNAGYTKDRPFRIGAGTSMKVGVLQMHVFSNNIIGLINAKYLQSVDVQFGLSWVWKNKKVKKSV